MKTNFHAQIAAWKFATLLVFILLLYATFSGYMQEKRAENLLSTQLTLIANANERHVQIRTLCEITKDQEYIIRREIPLSRMTWTKMAKDICK